MKDQPFIVSALVKTFRLSFTYHMWMVRRCSEANNAPDHCRFYTLPYSLTTLLPGQNANALFTNPITSPNPLPEELDSDVRDGQPAELQPDPGIGSTAVGVEFDDARLDFGCGIWHSLHYGLMIAESLDSWCGWASQRRVMGELGVVFAEGEGWGE
jgi:hypothetical protein